MFGKKKPKLKCHVFERFATCGTGYTLNYDSGECEVRMIAETKKKHNIEADFDFWWS